MVEACLFEYLESTFSALPVGASNTDLLLTEHLNYTMLYNTNVNVHVMELPDYLSVFPCSWMNTEEQRKFILEYQ